MLKGIGTDLVYIPGIQRILDQGGETDPFFTHTFTEHERMEASARVKKAEFYASRFAVKEAVFKVLAPILKDQSPDLRKIESLHHEDGSPYVNTEEYLKPYLEQAGISRILISVSADHDYATAYAAGESVR
ncbi:MAG: holo-ACP synthase [Bulleidia sp.]